ncbi:hypothetical protein, partial [Symbiobacterium thermophilum]
ADPHVRWCERTGASRPLLLDCPLNEIITRVEVNLAMHCHPDTAYRIAEMRSLEYNPHLAVHRHAIEEMLRARRAEAALRRRFFLRFWLRSILFRLAPGLARRLAL